MQVTRNKLIFLLIRFLNLIVDNVANEVIGCGGFIKSHADIDFAKIEVKLLTKQGVLKDKTDCSPSNGYYFLPIYDKGEYILRIAPPHGWSFEPEEVRIRFDGETDICSLGKDVDFVFKGFGITGKVILPDKEILTGARGVNVQLRSVDGSYERFTISDKQGVFSFTPIIPGKYILKVSHPKWHFIKSEHSVIVKEGNTELPPDALIVSGFDINGRVDVTEQLPSSIWLALFADEKQKTGDGVCEKNDILCSQAKHNVELYKSTPLQYAKVSSRGDYVFHNIAPGKYLLIPLSDNPELKLHWKPEHIQLEVGKDYIELETKFQIAGFSVTGQVLKAAKGPPIAEAIIKLNGKQVASTNSNGVFTLSHVPSAGMYTLQVEAKQMKFPLQHIPLQITTITIPPITPTEYEVCGLVVSKNSYQVSVSGLDSNFRTTTSTNANTGVWCTYLPNGKYTVEVLTSDIDKKNAVQFYPVSQLIEVNYNPVKDIIFSQLRATVKGALKCLPDAPPGICLETEITLSNLNVNGERNGQVQKTKAKNGTYVFENILPGLYEVTIQRFKLCFNATQVEINVKSIEETVPVFEQHGYEINIISSHRAMLKYSHTLTPGLLTTVKLLSGLNTLCVAKYGIYNMKLEDCHTYDLDNVPTSFSTADTSSLIVNAVAHKVGIRFLLSQDMAHEDFHIYVESDTVGKQWVKGKMESNVVDGMMAYRYETSLKPGEVLRITPHSEVLLFEPTTKTITGSNDCVDVAFSFHTSRGVILRGKVEPAIKDAKITLKFPQNPELMPQTVLTSSEGTFKFSAFRNNLEYELSGEKESYVFSEYNRATSTFHVHKLGDITVQVNDINGKPLSGVLISMSGGESYRRNLMTRENGQITFHSLAPSQYFVKPLMKEFKFEPNSKMIELKNGETVELNMIGKQVAYSVFGSVTSLNGSPFAQLSIQSNTNELCLYHQEEATTEINGQYRLRGLQPNCNYTIKIKNNDNNNIISHSIPPQLHVEILNQNIHDVDFVAISPLTYVDVVVRVTASTNDFYKTLSLCMYRRGSYDAPVYLQRLETPHKPKERYNPGIMAFLPRIPLDKKTIYIVELRSTLSDSIYKYQLPSKQFVADKGTVFVELNFTPEIRATDADLNQNSISALILVALVAIVYFKQDIAMNCFEFVWSHLSSLIENLTHQRQQQQQQHQQKTTNRSNARKVEMINQKEIEQMAEQINAIKKKKNKKI